MLDHHFCFACALGMIPSTGQRLLDGRERLSVMGLARRRALNRSNFQESGKNVSISDHYAALMSMIFGFGAAGSGLILKYACPTLLGKTRT